MSRARAVALAAVILLIAANLRPAVVGVSPLAAQIRADLHVGSAVTGLLTTVPVLCFGLLAPFAGRWGRRFGVESTLLVALVALTAGIVLRLAPSFAPLLIGGVLAGSAIAVGNTLMPVVVKRDFPHRTGLMTGLYSTMISGGGALAAAVTVPLEGATGLGWRQSLALWAIFAALALVLWLPFVRRARRLPASSVPAPAVRGLWRHPLAWQVTLVMGLQSFQFYALTAWAPTLFVEAGLDSATAGLLLSLAGLSSLPTSLLTPVLATKRPSQHHMLALLLVLWVAGYLGLVLAPTTLPWLWMVLIGLGQGVGISLGLTLITLRSPDAAHTAELSGMAQGVGYVIAGVGPLLLGWVHDLTVGWTVPVILLMVLLVPLAIAGVGATRNLHVGTSPAPVAVTGPAEPGPAEPGPAEPGPAEPGPVGPADGVVVHGRVHTAGGDPVAGATLTIVDERGRQVGLTHSDTDGSYRVDAPSGPVLVICAATTHTPLARRLAPDRHGEPTDLHLAPAGNG